MKNINYVDYPKFVEDLIVFTIKSLDTLPWSREDDWNKESVYRISLFNNLLIVEKRSYNCFGIYYKNEPFVYTRPGNIKSVTELSS